MAPSTIPSPTMTQTKLARVFSDPSRGLWLSPHKLAKAAGVSVSEATSFLADPHGKALQVRELTAEHHTPAARDQAHAYVPAGGAVGTYGADVVYFKDYAGVRANKKRTAVLTVLNLNSRYVYARGLVAATADKVSEAFMSIVAEQSEESKGKQQAPIVTLITDGGPEFKGSF